MVTKKNNRTSIRGNRSNIKQDTNTVLEMHKESIGKVVTIPIDHRTSIQVSSELTEQERNERVLLYRKNHKVMNSRY